MASTSPERTARRVSSASLRRATNPRRERAGSFCGERFFVLSANLFPPSSNYYSGIPRSSPKSTFFGFDKSPMSLCGGGGDRLMSVGTAPMSLLSASAHRRDFRAPLLLVGG